MGVSSKVSGVVYNHHPSPNNKHLNVIGERKLGRLVDALALGGDEGRDKLR